MNAGAANGCGDAGGEVAVGNQFDARSRLANLGDEVVMRSRSRTTIVSSSTSRWKAAAIWLRFS